MKTKTVTLILFIGILSTVNAQDHVDTNEMVGFACYAGGRPSETVEKFTRKLKNKNYKWISKQLTSTNNAERYMSVITLEKLSEMGKYNLNETELNLISDIKKSTDLVSVCSGCSYFQKLELKHMFTEEMLLMARHWLNSNF